MRLLLYSLLLLGSMINCNQSDSLINGEMKDSEHKYTNSLISESSPYLLQHAHNPVNWYPWGDEALEKAKSEDKLLLISIGYSACHWCHVMEHESFEDTAVARIMNEYFICIKVDREERPDVDQIYMNAVQLMTQRGGWPLNCFALPDGRPVYGGTYFQKEQWTKILKGLSEEYRSNPAKFHEYAKNLTEGIQQSDVIEINNNEPNFKTELVEKLVSKWTVSFDSKEGGPNHAPKFPIPNNYDFLLQYGHLSGDTRILDHVQLTLSKMAKGGIYDQIGGGFARYSTDVMWKVPHFEKMLYDNGQLLALYSSAFQKFKNPLYKHVVYQTINFLERELTSKEGAFYSALDADSGGEEGKYYVWTEQELSDILGKDFELVTAYYNVGRKGKWEHGQNILLRGENEEEIANKFGFSMVELGLRIDELNAKLLKAREERIRPGLDDKILTSWNALTISGLTKSYEVFKEERFLDLALKNARFIQNKQMKADGSLFHNYKNGKSSINAYLEDYCFTIEAYLDLYQITFDQLWLELAKDLLDYSIEHFYDAKSGMFYFTSDMDKALIARKMEINDNVIPASNSSMAKALFSLGHFYDNKAYLNMAISMLNNVEPHMASYPSGYSNWGQLYLKESYPFYEIAINGSQVEATSQGLGDHYIPNKVVIGSKSESQLPLLANKFVAGETFIYVCQNKTCQLPVTEISEALKQIQ